MADERIDELAVISGKEAVMKAVHGELSTEKGLLNEYNFPTRVEIFKGVLSKVEDKLEGATVIGLAFDTLRVPKRVEKSVMEPEQVVGILDVIEAYTNNEKVLIPEQALNLLSSLLEDWRQEHSEGAQGGAGILNDLITNRRDVIPFAGDENRILERAQKRERLYQRAQEVITNTLKKLAESYRSRTPLDSPVSPSDVNEMDSMDSIHVLFRVATTPEQKALLKTIGTDAWRYLKAGEVSEELFQEPTSDVMKNNKWTLYRGLTRLQSVIYS